ncbi:MAG: MobA/MobL family protein, partial [Nitrososphaerota archaeon]|nr:MobA/MobL family protein [Nitrososphaerota archaeon]
MAIFYMDVKIIGRSSGRSATGAAAYRAGEKLHSVAHASYQSGERLQGKKGKDGKITHDYTKKSGVVHKEILLPDNAPEEFKDRETLWNAVE